MNQELTVTKHNDLINAQYRLSLAEMRIIQLAVGHINPTKFTKSQISIKLNIADFGSEFGVTNYQQVRESVDSLADRWIVRISGKLYKKFRWITSIEWEKGKEELQINFSPEIQPYLLGMKKRFTSYKLFRISGLQSQYSIRLYEMLKQREKVGKWRVAVDVFRNTIDAPYKEFKELNRRCIIPAIKELNKKTDLKVLLVPQKKGRRITELVFFMEKQNPDLFD